MQNYVLRSKNRQSIRDILSKYKETIQSIFCKNLLELPEAEYIRHTQQMQGDKYRVFGIGFAGTAGMDSCSATVDLCRHNEETKPTVAQR